MTLTQATLTAVLGPELTGRLLSQWAGCRLPKRPDLIPRDRAILGDLDAGLSYRETAERHDLSISQVVRIAKGKHR